MNRREFIGGCAAGAVVAGLPGSAMVPCDTGGRVIVTITSGAAVHKIVWLSERMHAVYTLDGKVHSVVLHERLPLHPDGSAGAGDGSALYGDDGRGSALAHARRL